MCKKIITKQIIVLLLFFTCALHAQEKEIRGTVTDRAEVPLPGATVAIKGTSKGTTTDFDGNYVLKVDENDVVVISFVGYVTQEIAVKGKSYINIDLAEDVSQLDEVVIVSFGNQKKKSMVSSISTVNPSKLKIPSSNLTTALAGNVSGIIAYQRGGEPGADNAEFFVRGATTFASSAPLILIDGIELDVEDLRKLHPDDIASFSVMKDATSTALYGARGANGVVFVTTKEGKEGPLRVNARIETSFSAPTSNLELADPITYMRLGNEAVTTRDLLSEQPYTLRKIENTIAGNNPLLYPTTDWHKELFKDYTVNKRFNFSLNGGGKKARYYLSIAGSQDSGILDVPKVNDLESNIDLKQLNLRSTTNINLTKTTKLKLGFVANYQDYGGPRQGGSDVYSMVMRTNPVRFSPFYEKDEANQFKKHILFGNQTDGVNDVAFLNPLAQLLSGYRETTTNKIIARIELTQDLDFITEGLEFKFLYSGNTRSTFSSQRTYSPFYYQPFENIFTNEISLLQLNPTTGTEYLTYQAGATSASKTSYYETRLTYKKDINEKHSVGGVVVMTANQRNSTVTTGGGSARLELSLPSRNMGISGRINYSFLDRYFFEGAFGYNGSEKFSEDFRWGFFPSAGVAWSISDEAFFAGAKENIDNLKFRASYGITGNDNIGGENDRFLYLSRANLNSGSFTFGEFFDNTEQGVGIERYENNAITWEKSKKLNVGFDIGLFNKIDFEFSLFHEKREDILVNKVIPATFGLTAPVRANLGATQNTGMDGSIVYSESFKNGMWIQFRANYTFAASEITKFEEPDFSATPWRSRIGQSIAQNFGYIAERLFVDQAEVDNSPTQFGEYTGGDIKFRDINGDGIISDLDRVPIGNPTAPEIIYGFGASMGHKGFDVSFFFQGAGNQSLWINPTAVAPFVGERQLLKAWADSHWSETNRDVYAQWPRLSDRTISNNTQLSTYFMRDASFLRLKSAEIGYSLPEKLANKLQMNKVRFYLSGTNLFVLSKFKLWDPELSGNGFSYPNQRVINAGLNISL